MKDAYVAARTGRTVPAVQSRRLVLRVRPFNYRSPQGNPVTWTPEMDRKLGTMSDVDLARKFGCTAMIVFGRRRRLGIAAFRG